MTKKALIVLGFLTLNLVFGFRMVVSQTESPVFKYGIGSMPYSLDPAEVWDSASIDVLDQVMEGLAMYDLFDPEMNIIPCLATNIGTWNSNATDITFLLRHNVTFHDGSPFNASAVKYSFDRLYHLIDNNASQLTELYTPLAQMYPATPFLINETVIINEFTIKFILNYPYMAFSALLCFSGSYIVHPDMPYDRVLELNETLYGTGPYALDSYSTSEIHFLTYNNYWRSQPEIQEMRWIFYNDDVARQQALLAGDIQMVDGWIAYWWDSYPNIIVSTTPSASINYLGMNNKIINRTLRQAISYAIDYDYVIDVIMNGLAVRTQSPIPAGIKFHDPTLESPILNVTMARKILIDANLSKGLTEESGNDKWETLARDDPIARLNYTYNIGNRVRGDLGLLVYNNLIKIGINISYCGLTWPAYLECISSKFDRLQLYMTGWAPDYNDPSNYINLLFSNTSSFNSAQVNDTLLQTAMMNALSMPNESQRRETYGAIQHYLMEDLVPVIFLFQPLSICLYNKALGNFPSNIMGKHYFYPCTWDSNDETETDGKYWTKIAILGCCCIGIISFIVIPCSHSHLKSRHRILHEQPRQPSSNSHLYQSLGQSGPHFFCSICNAPADPGDNYCQNCGIRFKNEQ